MEKFSRMLLICLCIDRQNVDSGTLLSMFVVFFKRSWTSAPWELKKILLQFPWASLLKSNFFWENTTNRQTYPTFWQSMHKLYQQHSGNFFHTKCSNCDWITKFWIFGIILIERLSKSHICSCVNYGLNRRSEPLTMPC